MRALLAALTRSPICRRNIVAGLVGLLLGSASGYLLILRSSQYAPVIIHEEREVNASTVRDGHIDIYIDLDRLRDCPAETSRWLWTWVDYNGIRTKQFFPLASSATTMSDPGRDQHLILSLPLPAGVWAGEWYYWAKTVEHCALVPSLFRSPVRETADIPIRILRGPS